MSSSALYGSHKKLCFVFIINFFSKNYCYALVHSPDYNFEIFKSDRCSIFLMIIFPLLKISKLLYFHSAVT